MDRLSRDQEDIAGLFKRMAYANVEIVTLSEGEVTHLHVGLNGTMNALFLKDLADKTRRGLRGRVELGKSGGGKPLSPCDQRGTVQPSIGMQLIQDERRNVCSRYASSMEA
jgi:DNA invertase Pin-like site-specific DNA recombinase